MNVIVFWVGDKLGIWGYCLMSVVVQDNVGVCDFDIIFIDLMVVIVGYVYDFQGDKILDIEVQLNDLDMVMMDILGDYWFSGMFMGGSYEIMV